MLFSTTIVLFSLMMAGFVHIGSLIRLTEEDLRQRLLTTARSLAEIPAVAQGLEHPADTGLIHPIAKKFRIVNNVTYIVVLDMNRIRLSDPLEHRIGTRYKGREIESAFAENSYTEKVQGELGTAIRAYVPVMNKDHIQVGVVMVGHLLPSIGELLMNQKHNLSLTFSFSLLFGIFGSYQLARHLKRQMFNLEPHEIARILEERTATFHAMHEGVIAIDNNEHITIFNDKAKQIFRVSGDVLGKPIREVIPDTRLPEILELQQSISNQELRFGNTLLWSNRFLIKVNNKTVGAIAIFQDRTEVARMAEELTGVKEFVDALRVQNHEYMNKLHTIAGLLQLDQKEKALEYLFEVSEEQEELASFFTNRIADKSISGLLLSKIRRGKELGIDVEIDRNSNLDQFPELMDHHHFVLILGNLIENAFDSFENIERKDKHIYVSIEQNDDVCSLLVEDNGSGMNDETYQRMLEKGFSTKQTPNRGVGLHLVNQLVVKHHGEMKCETEPGMGTSFLITFPMKGGAQA